jgi:hypothetical protein
MRSKHWSGNGKSPEGHLFLEQKRGLSKRPEGSKRLSNDAVTMILNPPAPPTTDTPSEITEIRKDKSTELVAKVEWK